MNRKYKLAAVAAAIIISTASVRAVTGGKPPVNDTQTQNTTNAPAISRSDNHPLPPSADAVSAMSSKPAPVSTPAPAQAPAPTPSPATGTPTPRVKAVKEIVIDPDNSDCLYTFDDGSTVQFHWKVTDPQGAQVLDQQTQQYHYAPTTLTSGTCNDTVIGSPKES